MPKQELSPTTYKTRTGEGKPVERIRCPLCGWIRTTQAAQPYRRTTPYYQAGEPKRIRFDIDVENVPMWRLERLAGKGRGSKEATIELLDSKLLGELPGELKEQIKKQCQRILALL